MVLMWLSRVWKCLCPSAMLFVSIYNFLEQRYLSPIHPFCRWEQSVFFNAWTKTTFRKQLNTQHCCVLSVWLTAWRPVIFYSIQMTGCSVVWTLFTHGRGWMAVRFKRPPWLIFSRSVLCCNMASLLFSPHTKGEQDSPVLSPCGTFYNLSAELLLHDEMSAWFKKMHNHWMLLSSIPLHLWSLAI